MLLGSIRCLTTERHTFACVQRGHVRRVRNTCSSHFTFCKKLPVFILFNSFFFFYLFFFFVNGSSDSGGSLASVSWGARPWHGEPWCGVDRWSFFISLLWLSAMSNSPKKKEKRRRLFLEKEEAGERRFGPEPGENRVFLLESVEIVEPAQEPMQVFYERENTLTEFWTQVV